MYRFSALSLLRNAVSNHENWPTLWRSPEPKSAYDVIIIGGGGHGLATAFYLAKEHGIRNVAVLEKGWIGGGNTARNTTIVRSNYLFNESAALYEHSLKLWEGLAGTLNFNVMLSQRGVLNLAHNLSDVREGRRRVYANRLNGIDADWLSAEEVKEVCPILNISKEVRYPVCGATYQARGGTARHDAVAWGYARAADDFGVDIIQNCEVKGFIIKQNRILGVETTRGKIMARKVAIAAAGSSTLLAEMADIRLPIQSYPLQAFVTEPVKPVHNCVVMSNTVHVYVSQSDRGELVVGAGIDNYNSYSQRGSFHVI
jgi:sarcosine oxidase subunit beta